MDPKVIQPGDRVIDLASLARTAGMISGLVTGLLVAWLATGALTAGVAFGFGGAIGGRVLGRLLGKLRYTQAGHQIVVKRGPAALQATMTAALTTSLPSAIMIWLGCLTLLGGPAPSFQTGGICLVAGVFTGVLLGLAASRL
jgi:hypothetical protein